MNQNHQLNILNGINEWNSGRFYAAFAIASIHKYVLVLLVILLYSTHYNFKTKYIGNEFKFLIGDANFN